jgi:hypothetical protein
VPLASVCLRVNPLGQDLVTNLLSLSGSSGGAIAVIEIRGGERVCRDSSVPWEISNDCGTLGSTQDKRKKSRQKRWRKTEKTEGERSGKRGGCDGELGREEGKVGVEDWLGG